MTPDELAEPYAEIVDEGRFKVREEPREQVRQWLREQAKALRDSERRRGVPFDLEEPWITLLMIALEALPDDKRFTALTRWRHGDEEEDLDEVAITLAMQGNRRVRLNAAERREAVLRMTRKGQSAREIAMALGMTTKAVATYRRREHRAGDAAEVARLLAEGLTAFEVGQRLGMSVRTVLRRKAEVPVEEEAC